VALAEKLKASPKKAEAVIASEAFQRLDSDARFAAVFEAFNKPSRKAAEYACGKAARIERRRDAIVLTLDEKRAPDFGAFLVERLDALYRDYRKEKEESGKL
jgi:ParB family chromosome partitioning protein